VRGRWVRERLQKPMVEEGNPGEMATNNWSWAEKERATPRGLRKGVAKKSFGLGTKVTEENKEKRKERQKEKM